MSFFKKSTHIGNRSKSYSSFKSEKGTHNFCNDHENKPLVFNKKSVNSKMNKAGTNENVLQHKVCDTVNFGYKSINKVINKVKQYLDKSSLLTLYHFLINSYVQYCAISWCQGNVSMIQKLQKVSTKAINLNNTKKQKNSNVFQQQNLLTIQQSKQLQIAKFMHKYFNKSLPPAFSNIFDSNFLSKKATIHTRSKSKLCPQYCRIKLTQQTLKFRDPMLWNKLPVALKDIKSLPKFIKCFKECIINQ